MKNIYLSSNIPEYNMGLEYLDLLKNKQEDHLFYGNTSIVPAEKRVKILIFFERAKIDGLVYITEGIESVINSLSKADFTKILKDNNLPVSGNKDILAKRIADNLGFDTLYTLGEVTNKIKLTELGIKTINEYRIEFKRKFDLFQQEVYNMFMLNKLDCAIFNVSNYKKSYPFNSSGFFITYSEKDLLDVYLKVKRTNILTKIGVPNIYHNAILSTICMYYSFSNFYLDDKLEEIYSGLRLLLVQSDLIKNKDIPFVDFRNHILGYRVTFHPPEV